MLHLEERDLESDEMSESEVKPQESGELAIYTPGKKR
jgi:hypothetical protein